MHHSEPTACLGQELLAKALDRVGWSHQELERRLQVSKGLVSRWLSGQRRPGLEHALALERLLEVPAKSWLIAATAA